MIKILAISDFWKWFVGGGFGVFMLGSLWLQFSQNRTLTEIASKNSALVVTMQNLGREIKEIKSHNRRQDYYIELGNVHENEIRQKNGMRKIQERIIEFPSMDDFNQLKY